MSDEIRAEQLWQTAKALVRAGNGWKAKELLKTIFTAFPNHAVARAEYAGILLVDGEIDTALVHAAFAFRLNPEIPGLARRLGELYFLTGFYYDALQCFERAAKAGDKDGDVSEKIALCREILNAATEDSNDTTH